MIAHNRNYNEDDGTSMIDIINAALENNNKMVIELLGKGADVNTSYQGFSLLHIACMNGNDPLVDALLHHGRTVQSIDFSLKTTERKFLAWQLAAENSNYSIAQKVFDAEHTDISKDPDVAAATPKYSTPKLIPFA